MAGDIWLGINRIETLPKESRGSYVLLIRLTGEQVIATGNLADIRFSPGFYAYVGSALNGLRPRLLRHLSGEKKRHWHIDYLLERAFIIDIAVHKAESRSECAIAGTLSTAFDTIPGFGSSDCLCRSHLFYTMSETGLRQGIENAVSSLKTP